MKSGPSTSFWRFVPVLVVLTAAFGVLIPTIADAKGKAQRSFFNSVEVRSSNLKPFKKWRAALKRYSIEKGKKQKKKSCSSKRLDICNYGQWGTFLKSLQGKDKLTQIRAVNHRMNKARYITDKNNWGRKDYWATPAEFMTNFGDCEDYAIIKFLSLKLLGFNESDLRVVAVKDLNLKVGHAVLIVFWKDPKSGKKRSLLLDNQIKKVVDSRSVRHYQPVFSINSKNWWRHRS
ncbi:MAG: transglutaminase-like cysteine peptidase [Rhodospirillales bacterium]|nr:transglutaminase-like cysteine peptidase [Alphaproteobacteria bacterium]MBL6948892.1 transglutaminase-like cysteine peptidase [Rhodospirillales bacterium]